MLSKISYKNQINVNLYITIVSGYDGIFVLSCKPNENLSRIIFMFF